MSTISYQLPDNLLELARLLRKSKTPYSTLGEAMASQNGDILEEVNNRAVLSTAVANCGFEDIDDFVAKVLIADDVEEEEVIH
jgi:hypothetical protein